MRLLALTRYSSLGPSSRVRFYQYVPYLTSCGVELQVAPLLGDDYVRSLYSGKRQSVLSVVMAYISRVSRLMNSRSFDLLWVEKELFPWFPARAESFLARRGIPYVADYDDAVFHRYDLHDNPLIRALLRKSVDAVMRQATTVVVGNDYLAERARRAGASRIEYLPSVVDVDQYSPGEKTDRQFRIGWIGSPITAPYLGLIREALEEASKQIDARLVLVGSGDQDPLPGVAKEVLPWSEDSEVAHIQSFDVGIMPLPDGPFEQGKCGYKLIQYMACGLPVIASPVGVNTRIVEQGKTGFLASSNAEWVQALVMLSRNANMRNELGKAGRRKIEQEYSLQIAAPRLLEIFTEAASHKESDRLYGNRRRRPTR
ncbi:MAG: glycosyltransferase family 4 protein [Chloroflexota bacterium]